MAGFVFALFLFLLKWYNYFKFVWKECFIDAMDGENNLLLTCRESEDGIIILRCETRDAVVRLPETVFGKHVIELGPYAMARRAPNLPGSCETFSVCVGAGCQNGHDASSIRRLTLPSCMRRVGDYAFYDCHSLEYLQAGESLAEIGSDAFLNCVNFCILQTKISADGTSCLRGVLREHHGELLCVMQFIDGEQAHLLFPPYSEEYEELAAPHIFGYHIEGAGFTYRQCFDGRKVSFSQYDAALERLILTQDFDFAVRIGLERLCWPKDLSPTHRARYESLLSSHANESLRILLKNKDSEGLIRMLPLGLFPANCLQTACDIARTDKNTEMLGILLNHLHHTGTCQTKTFDL